MINKILVFCFLILCAAGCGRKNGGIDLTPQNSRTAAAEIGARFINSSDQTLAKLKGKVVVLDFWATWCGPCRMEIPSFVKLYSLYHPKGLELLGLSVENPGSQPAGYFDQFLKNFSVNYPIGFADENTSRTYGIQAIPATFFIDKTGKIATAFVGVHSEEEISAVIEKLLSE